MLDGWEVCSLSLSLHSFATNGVTNNKMLGWIPLTVFKYSDGAQWKIYGLLVSLTYLMLRALPVLVSAGHVAIPSSRIFLSIRGNWTVGPQVDTWQSTDTSLITELIWINLISTHVIVVELVEQKWNGFQHPGSQNGQWDWKYVGDGFKPVDSPDWQSAVASMR
jgi:hypothetical protein